MHLTKAFSYMTAWYFWDKFHNIFLKIQDVVIFNTQDEKWPLNKKLLLEPSVFHLLPVCGSMNNFLSTIQRMFWR